MTSQAPVTIVTGGAGALGTAVTLNFLQRGDHVVVADVNDRQFPRLRQLANDSNRLYLEVVDLTSFGAVEALVAQILEKFGRIDALVNLAGGFAGGQPLWETSEVDFEYMLTLNLRTAFITCRVVLPSMVARKYGRIVNVSSRTAVQPSPGTVAYGVSKAGVASLTQALAQETIDHGITVNCVMPSVIDTPANRAGDPNADFARWVKPEELATIIRWLTSVDAAPISGAAIPVYGRA